MCPGGWVCPGGICACVYISRHQVHRSYGKCMNGMCVGWGWVRSIVPLLCAVSVYTPTAVSSSHF